LPWTAPAWTLPPQNCLSSRAFRDTFGVDPAPVFRKIERFDRLV
jgi:hypothetical protein